MYQPIIDVTLRMFDYGSKPRRWGKVQGILILPYNQSIVECRKEKESEASLSITQEYILNVTCQLESLGKIITWIWKKRPAKVKSIRHCLINHR